MDSLDRAIDAARSRISPRRKTATRLAETIEPLMEGRLQRRHERFAALSRAWKELLPPNLAQQCEITDFTDGRLKVKVANPVYRFELQQCSAELLKQLNRHCPRARLTRIDLLGA